MINIEKYIKTKTSEILYSKLKEISDDHFFIVGILSLLKKDEQKMILIRELNKGLKDIKTIILYSVDISDGLEK